MSASPEQTGDPTYRRLLAAIAEGAVPFTVQGNLNGHTIEGGATLGWELIDQLPDHASALDRLVVHVGGGAFASAQALAFEDALAAGLIDHLPRLDTVQTQGGFPLARAHALVLDRLGVAAGEAVAPDVVETGLREIAAHRSDYMWPWETEPVSLAHGILDDETYDWLAVVRAMLLTGGRTVVVDEATIEAANRLARPDLGIDADHTGTAGLAGLMTLTRDGLVGPGRDRGRDLQRRPTLVGRRPAPQSAHQAPTRRRSRDPVRSFKGRDILSLRDMTRDEYFRIFQVADDLLPIARDRRNTDLLANKTLLTAFYQPSTRTRLSTEAAMHRLGGHVLGFSDAKMTRAGDFYMESLKDTFHMLEYYGDVIAIRHYQQGAPAEAAQWSSVPVINCGDGWGEHPTQVLTDLYTIWKEKGTLDGLTLLLVGDMRMRTMHSLLYAMSQFDMKALLVGPKDMGLLPEFKAELDARATFYEEVKDVRDVIDQADVIYMEPVVQADYTQSRVDSKDAEKGLTPKQYVVTLKLLAEKAKRDAFVLHSLPRMDELTPDVDESRWGRYWVEAFNGVVMRMSLLSLVLGAAE